ncbi:type II toxin-antitoxin system RelE family toxin [Iningainema tapete]|uniref:Type II toxin-antitoxin system RelE/ParE family toxin n=1 Tax=Iningainema tapete BLCC-T55 TaxID=2748662 RepID=A0A8J6XP36_9CYAN|nr:type II toxin-antitoxin system RelE/ParE family toxin [Iningainema tapete]MBD2778688.1 type II toxin-antitoxin system RelE/ParE family toxin [Iningainema tapete BLCC-T55]
MNYELEIKAEALADLEGLTQVVRDRIATKINWLAENFEYITPQPLTGNLTFLYKLRVGDYRVLYSFSTEKKIITVHQIGHRRDIYRA